MEVTEEVAKAIQAEVSEEQLRKVAVQEGMYTLREAGLQKAREGVTSVEEVLRRTVAHEESLPAYLVNPDVEEYGPGHHHPGKATRIGTSSSWCAARWRCSGRS